MSRTEHPRTEPNLLKPKLALPALALMACAALYAHGAAAQSTGQHPAAERISYNSDARREDAYALVRDTGHGTNMSGDSLDWKEIEAVKRNMHGEFLWFRDGGKTWVVQDQNILSRAKAARAPVDELGKQMDAYGQQMDRHGKDMEALGRQMERAAAQQRHDAGTTREPAQARASMEDISRKMHEASRPMDALGKQMDALGKQMEKESKAADKVVRQLIREAREKGLAHPAPAAA